MILKSLLPSGRSDITTVSANKQFKIEDYYIWGFKPRMTHQPSQNISGGGFSNIPVSDE
ncbi:hypothetical protein [Anabaena sp. CCY 0017]|uniref:hypothetical protein n=1 Tax=Anabaena sp. CCY 0017 TaxID=3103866 RepID=UPI0039C5F9EA